MEYIINTENTQVWSDDMEVYSVAYSPRLL